jgi:protease I
MKNGNGKPGKLRGKTIAILATDGFEQVELTRPREAFEQAGAKTVLVSLKAGKIQGFNHFEKGDSFDVDLTLDQADVNSFDGLLLPGGVHNPDKLRSTPEAVDFVKSFADSGKPIAAICHGPWTLIEAGVVRGRTMTSYPSIKTDLKNAGANWVDREVVVDNGLVTSRKPDDIPAFVVKAIEELSEGQHRRRAQPSA